MKMELFVIAPWLIVAVTGVLALLVDLFLRSEGKGPVACLSIIGLALAFMVNLVQWKWAGDAANPVTGFGNTVIADHLSLFSNGIFLISCGLVILSSVSYLKQQDMNCGEYYALILFATCGMMVMASSLDLAVLLLGLELTAISFYILCGLRRQNLKSNEAALKFFILAAFASGFLIYGIALFFGCGGHTSLVRMAEFITKNPDYRPAILFTSIALLSVGLGFKISAVPFHVWVPDVYQGAATPVSAFMSVGSKAAGFIILIRLFGYAFAPLHDEIRGALIIIAVLTMCVGNLAALMQTNVKRMLAYSSIAQAGYLVVALAVSHNSSYHSLLFYLAAYTFMNLGAFGMVILFERENDKNLSISDYSGTGFKQPWAGITLALFMVALAGIPPTSGFMGKFYIFSDAVKNGYVGLAIIGVLNSVVSVYYYLQLVVVMFMRPAVTKEVVSPVYRPSLITVLAICAFFTLFLGLFPGVLLSIVSPVDPVPQLQFFQAGG